VVYISAVSRDGVGGGLGENDSKKRGPLPIYSSILQLQRSLNLGPTVTDSKLLMNDVVVFVYKSKILSSQANKGKPVGGHTLLTFS
jgi:hypothetical protein